MGAGPMQARALMHRAAKNQTGVSPNEQYLIDQLKKSPNIKEKNHPIAAAFTNPVYTAAGGAASGAIGAYGMKMGPAGMAGIAAAGAAAGALGTYIQRVLNARATRGQANSWNGKQGARIMLKSRREVLDRLRNRYESPAN